MLPPNLELVTITDGGRVRDGIVFERPSSNKVVVAVIDRHRGPVFRTVQSSLLSQRDEPGDDDELLERLIRRTPHAAGGQRGRAAAGQAGRAAHTRGAPHRSTGR